MCSILIAMAELQLNVALKGTAFMSNWSVYIIPKLPHAILLLLTNKCAILCICWLIKDESIKNAPYTQSQDST
jgi:hypothetical protein